MYIDSQLYYRLWVQEIIQATLVEISVGQGDFSGTQRLYILHCANKCQVSIKEPSFLKILCCPCSFWMIS